MESIKKFIRRFDEFMNRPIVFMPLLTSLAMFFLVMTDAITISFPSIGNLAKNVPVNLGSFGFFMCKTAGIVLLIFLTLRFIFLVAETWRDLKDKKNPIRMEIVTVWSIIIGIIFGGGFAEYLKYSEKRAKRQEQDARQDARIAKIHKTCETFPEEKICKVPLEQRDASWTYTVERCFSDKEEPSLVGLPDECNSFGAKGLEDFILPVSMVGKEEGIGPVTPPAILSQQTEQGEAIAKGITPQTVVIAGEVVMKENFARLVNEIAASHSATGKLPGPCNEGYLAPAAPDDPIGILIEKHRLTDCTIQPVPPEESEAVFAHILDGQLYPEVKLAFEQEFEIKLGLSRNLEGLSETEKQGVGMVIGLFNHVARLHEEARQRVRVRAQAECAKYPPGTLRPTRCAAFKRQQ